MKEILLKNKVNVIYHAVNKQPFCGVEIWFHFGAADDPEGMSGIAHLLEHLLHSLLDDIDPFFCFNRDASTSKDRIRIGGVIGERHAVTVLKQIIDRILSFRIDEYHYHFHKQKVIYEIENLRKSPILEYITYFESEISNEIFRYEKSTFGIADDIAKIDFRILRDYWYENLKKGITISLVGNIDTNLICTYLEESICFDCSLVKAEIIRLTKKNTEFKPNYNGILYVYDVGEKDIISILLTIQYLTFSFKEYPITVKKLDYRQCRAIGIYMPDNLDYSLHFNRIIDNIDVIQANNAQEYCIDYFMQVINTPSMQAKLNLENMYYYENLSFDELLLIIENLTIDQISCKIKEILTQKKIIISSKSNKYI